MESWIVDCYQLIHFVQSYKIGLQAYELKLNETKM